MVTEADQWILPVTHNTPPLFLDLHPVQSTVGIKEHLGGLDQTDNLKKMETAGSDHPRITTRWITRQLSGMFKAFKDERPA